MPTKQFYFKRKRVETGNDILQILKMVENPSNLPHLEKNSFRALSSASCCKKITKYKTDHLIHEFILEYIQVYQCTSS